MGSRNTGPATWLPGVRFQKPGGRYPRVPYLIFAFCSPYGKWAARYGGGGMKALVKSRREPGLWLEEVEKPSIGINDVLIRVLRTGICGTDVHIYNWDDWAQ